MTQPAPLLELRGVSQRYAARPDAAVRIARTLGPKAGMPEVQAVVDVDLSISRGEVVGLAGESGSGKSTLGRIAAGLIEPTAGTRLWQGRDPARLPPPERRAARLAVQMIFQDPYASLNPRMTVAQLVGEAPVVHGVAAADERDACVARMLERVGLDAALMRRYPHQLSGGQRSRVGIARALAVNPEFLVCDEAVAALDVSIQAQVLNLFLRLRQELGLTCLFISHDLGVVRHVSDRVLIMRLGRIVESGPTERIFTAPEHPYTRALLEGVPRLEARRLRPAPASTAPGASPAGRRPGPAWE